MSGIDIPSMKEGWVTTFTVREKTRKTPYRMEKGNEWIKKTMIWSLGGADSGRFVKPNSEPDLAEDWNKKTL